MPATSTCPTRDELQQLMLGALGPEETQRLAEHVEACESCVRQVRNLAGRDTLIESLRDMPTAVMELPKEAPLNHLMERLRGQVPGLGEAATVPPASPAEAGHDRELTDFLAPSQQPDEIGRLGSYRILKLLGAGGMGVVFLAEDPQLGRRLALKAMKPVLAASDSAKKRFLREARAMAAIENDHIITVHAVGEDRGVPFLAMQLLRGESLEDRLRREMALPLADVLRIGVEIATGLSAAHQRNLVHRDIKPDNIWLEGTTPPLYSGGVRGGSSGRVKILDFGLARGVDDQSALTQAGTIAGTPAYMAPEQIDPGQIDGGQVDHRSDFYQTAITDAGLDHLYGLKQLSELSLGGTKVTAEGVKKLATALPKCKIISDHGTFGPNVKLGE